MFQCNKCGCCCRSLQLSPDYADLDRGDGVCIYLVDNLCSIYDTRPLKCRVDECYEVLFKGIMSKEDYYRLKTHSFEIYRRHLNALDTVVTFNHKTDWNEFTGNEKIMTENLVLLVQLLYKMCQVKLVLSSNSTSQTNTINESAIQEAANTADALLAERGLAS